MYIIYKPLDKRNRFEIRFMEDHDGQPRPRSVSACSASSVALEVAQGKTAGLVKFFFSSCLTLIYLVFIVFGILSDEAVLPLHPAANLIILVFCLLLLGEYS